MFSHYKYIVRDIYHQSIAFAEKGNAEQADLILRDIVKEKSTPSTDHIVIKHVAYQQKKNCIGIEKVEIINDEIVFSIRLHVCGGYLYGPACLGSWIIYDVNNPDSYEVVDDIDEFVVNGTKHTFGGLSGIPTHSFLSFGEKVSYDKDYVDMKDDKYIEKETQTELKAYNIKTEENKCKCVTCKLHFKKTRLTNATINLIEGKGNENSKRYWNFFNINLNVNRIYL